MDVLVIGITGFLGSHLCSHLAQQGHRVHGCGRSSHAPTGCEQYARVDLLDPASLEPLEGPWDAAVLLAGHSVPSARWSDALVQENVSMAANALELVRRRAPGARTLVASSAHVYAPGPGRRSEDDPLDPRGPYGRSKLLVEEEAARFSNDLDLHLVRPFNQIGPGMPAGLVASDLVERVRSGLDPLVMQGPDSLRDFLDVRDGARALADLLQVDAPSGSVWNLASGKGRRISELARTCLQALGVDRELRFAAEGANELVGDPTRLAKATGFEPRHDLRASVDSLLEAPRG